MIKRSLEKTLTNRERKKVKGREQNHVQQFFQRKVQKQGGEKKRGKGHGLEGREKTKYHHRARQVIIHKLRDELEECLE